MHNVAELIVQEKHGARCTAIIDWTEARDSAP